MNFDNISIFLIIIIVIIIYYNNILKKSNRKEINIKEKESVGYSQMEQDIHVLSFYNNKQNGFFVDIGANNGILISNTYLLEKEYNWTGICVEPIPEKFNELVTNRPMSKCHDHAVYNESNLILNFDIAESDLLSGIDFKLDTHKDEVNKNKKTISVKTITLNDLLDQNNAPNFIEYLSVDTEGSELEILESVDLKKYTFGLIHVEHNYEEPKRTKINKLLTSNDYIYMRQNEFDDYYRHKNYF